MGWTEALQQAFPKFLGAEEAPLRQSCRGRGRDEGAPTEQGEGLSGTTERQQGRDGTTHGGAGRRLCDPPRVTSSLWASPVLPKPSVSWEEFHYGRGIIIPVGSIVVV